MTIDSILIGDWQLKSYHELHADGTKQPKFPEVRGFIQYSQSGLMSVQISLADRKPLPSINLNSLAHELLAEPYLNYVTYLGRYEHDDKQVKHHVMMSSHPNLEGMTLIRDYQIDGDELVLTSPVENIISDNEAEGMRGQLVWQRVTSLTA